MVEITTGLQVLAGVLTFGIPALILGYGAMINEIKVTKLLAMVNLMSLLMYFSYIGALPSWIPVLVIIIISLIFLILYKVTFFNGG